MGETQPDTHTSLASGDRIGPYEVIARIGAGGMGEVYRARDHRLRREVALKIVSPKWALDPARLARFGREAQVLAALNHPNIATLYGLEEVGGLQALVLELVEGKTLADRIAAQPNGLSVQETIGISHQVAAGLEAAHESGIVHRDLKPANIALRGDGTVKLLDFGLASALSTDESGYAGPTITMGATGVGTVLGTPAYMSPEQARGQALDKRTDIWSFGVVLYEMLTGRTAFQGPTTSDTIAAVLNLEPDWRTLPDTTPPQVRTLLQRCLEKDPRRRLRDIGDARIEFEALVASRMSSADHSVRARDEETATSRTHARPLRALAIGVAVISLIALGFAVATWVRPPTATRVGTIRMTALLPPGVSVTRGPGKILSLALSPDGRTLVVAGTDANGQRLYRRTLDGLEATPLAGTEGGLSPFFSPDGAWVGFFANRRMKRVRVGGGAALDITAFSGYPAGASWGKDNRIIFASGYLSPLWAVDAGGGTPTALTTPTAGEGHLYPELLPNGRTLLFNQGRWIHTLDLASGRIDRFVEGVRPRYAASGHLILSRGTTVLAAPFDPARLELTGPAVPIVESVATEQSSGGVHVAVSSEGTLAYVPATERYELVLVEADGSERLLSQARSFQNPQFSPNGQRVVVTSVRRTGEQPDLWIHDLGSTAPPSRLTFDGGRAPVWTPDGSSITYSRPTPNEGSGIYTRSADGGGEPRQIVALANFHWLVGWTPQRTLAYGTMEDVSADGRSLGSIQAVENRAPRAVVGPGEVWGGRLSPDGRWLAYYLSDSGDFEIYVSPFPNAGTRWLIAEGTDPSWSPDGSEIYYRSGTRLMAVTIDTAAGVRVLSSRLVIEPFTPPAFDDYDIHPDGKTLVLVRPAGAARGREITLVLNWPADLPGVTPQ